MQNISNAIYSKIKQEAACDDLTLVKVNYALTVLKNEGIKFILLFVFFFTIHQLVPFLFCSCILLPVRAFSGGLHMKTNVTCFLFSSSFFILSICVLPKAPLTELHYILLLTVSAMVICLLSPIATSRKPILSREKYIKCRAKAIGMCLAACLLLILLSNKAFFHSGVWVLTLQSIQLVLAFLNRKRKGEKRYGH